MDKAVGLPELGVEEAARCTCPHDLQHQFDDDEQRCRPCCSFDVVQPTIIRWASRFHPSRADARLRGFRFHRIVNNQVVMLALEPILEDLVSQELGDPWVRGRLARADRQHAQIGRVDQVCSPQNNTSCSFRGQQRARMLLGHQLHGEPIAELCTRVCVRVGEVEVLHGPP